MYGMVNKALQSYVTNLHGEGVWERIREKADVKEPHFVSMKQYDDKSTYDLVEAASSLLVMPADHLLREFGKYWVVFAKKEGYGEVFKISGDNFVNFMNNIDSLHSSLAGSFKNFLPPSFKITDIKSDSFTFHYYSKRPGLSNFAEGLLHGVAKHFDKEVEVTLELSRDKGHDHEEFAVKIL
jgi:hypothetical protein